MGDLHLNRVAGAGLLFTCLACADLAGCNQSSTGSTVPPAAALQSEATTSVGPPPSAPPTMDNEWPEQPNAQWPPDCLIEDVAAHPTQPWLALSCSDYKRELGALVIYDASSGSIRSVTSLDTTAAWGDGSHSQWHPDGKQLTTNLGTNGIALIRLGEWVGRAHPDQTRDTGVEHLWVGSRLFADTGAFFEIAPGGEQLEFDTQPIPPLQRLTWNATIGAVVAQAGRDLVAWDPIKRAAVWQTPLRSKSSATCAPDGLWCLQVDHASPKSPSEVHIYNGTTGQFATTVRPPARNFRLFRFGGGGALVLLSYTHQVGGPPIRPQLTGYRDTQLEWSMSVAPRRIEASHSLQNASGVEWSRDTNRLALLLNGQHVRIIDGHSGATLQTFHAPAPSIPSGLPDWYPGRHLPAYGFVGDLSWVGSTHVVRVAPHFISSWTVGGEKVGELVIPVKEP